MFLRRVLRRLFELILLVEQDGETIVAVVTTVVALKATIKQLDDIIKTMKEKN
jgi:hypothetical protein